MGVLAISVPPLYLYSPQCFLKCVFTDSWLCAVMVLPCVCMIERKEGKLMMLVLDWAKVLDSIFPDRLILCFRRFGIPEDMAGVIRAIYSDRLFL